MKTLKIFFQGTSEPILTKSGIKQRRLGGVGGGGGLTYFTARSNFATYAFTWENVTVMDTFEIIASCGLEFGLYINIKLND